MELFSVENILALFTLTILEVVLGIDNIVFISITVSKLDEARQDVARRLGLILAMLMRILLLLAISWIMLLQDSLFAVLGHEFSGRDLILLLGGVFLIAKATSEIHEKIERAGPNEAAAVKPTSFFSAIVQIILLDIIFSLDSVITAIGMADDVRIMIVAVIVSVIVMLLFAKAIGEFIEENPTFQMLALSFLLLIGVMLVADGFGRHVEKGYLYFAIGYSLFVEYLNMRRRKQTGVLAA